MKPHFFVRTTILLAALFATLAGRAQLAGDSIYFHGADLPDAARFLPAPPDTSEARYLDDLVQWQWGKTQRPTPRGERASRETLWKLTVVQQEMAPILGLDTISREATPALFRLLNKVYNTGNQSTHSAKRKYMRRRPFVQMGEDTWGRYDDDFLRTNGSYPSGHTAFGWICALTMAEMWPALQDTLLRNGFLFGESRVITGAHYQSDVSAGYLCAAAAWARIHTNPEYAADLRAARAEYIALRGLPATYDHTAGVGLPTGTAILNPPVDTTSYRYLADIARYWAGKALRTTPRGALAISDADNSLPHLLRTFGEAIHAELSPTATPETATLITYVRRHSKAAVRQLKAAWFRKRPFAQLHNTTSQPAYEDKEREESSFVSGHSCLAWCIALTLSEALPEHQDALLRRGYDYGESRIITGYHWATDVEAARLLACAVAVRLHNDAFFLRQLEKARHELQSLR